MSKIGKTHLELLPCAKHPLLSPGECHMEGSQRATSWDPYVHNCTAVHGGPLAFSGSGRDSADDARSTTHLPSPDIFRKFSRKSARLRHWWNYEPHSEEPAHCVRSL
eukprot:2308574-Prymnesium_polylepis.1